MKLEPYETAWVLTVSGLIAGGMTERSACIEAAHLLIPGSRWREAQAKHGDNMTSLTTVAHLSVELRVPLDAILWRDARVPQYSDYDYVKVARELTAV
jgi:hypothetical protein